METQVGGSCSKRRTEGQPSSLDLENAFFTCHTIASYTWQVNYSRKYNTYIQKRKVMVWAGEVKVSFMKDVEFELSLTYQNIVCILHCGLWEAFALTWDSINTWF